MSQFRGIKATISPPQLPDLEAEKERYSILDESCSIMSCISRQLPFFCFFGSMDQNVIGDMFEVIAHGLDDGIELMVDSEQRTLHQS